MIMNLRFVCLFVAFFFKNGHFISASTENELGYLSIVSPMFVGENITFLFIPAYRSTRIDFRVLRWQVLFVDDTSSFKYRKSEIEIEELTLYESGQAVYMELIKVNMTWDRAVVAVKDGSRLSNAITMQLQDRTADLYVLSYPSLPGGSALIAFYYPEGFNDSNAVTHWWQNRYGGDVQTDSNKKRIVFNVFNISHNQTLFLEYRKGTKALKSNDVYLFIGRLRLEPICTTSECSDCVCVHPGDVVTCSTEGTMLSLWIGINDIDVKRSNSNGSNEYTSKSFSITNRHHKSTVRCYMYVEFEKRNIVFNSSATLYVLGSPLLSDSSSHDVSYIFIGTAAAIAFVTIPLCITIKRRRRPRKKTRSVNNRGEGVNLPVFNQSEPMVGRDEMSDHEYADIDEEPHPTNASNENEHPNEFYITALP
ncbi:uncharacterized protein LOC127873716 isoform X1 [Dreissena polymorpha]|nr:uncharacterized protein LOC127873716 isoform X1 [Dreissena polymorpha]